MSRESALAVLVAGEEFTPATAAALLAGRLRLGTVAGDLAALGDLGLGDCAGALGLLLPGGGEMLEVGWTAGCNLNIYSVQVLCNLPREAEGAVLRAVQGQVDWVVVAATAATIAGTSSDTVTTLAAMAEQMVRRVRKREVEQPSNDTSLAKQVVSMVELVGKMVREPLVAVEQLVEHLDPRCGQEEEREAVAQAAILAYCTVVARMPLWTPLEELPLLPGSSGYPGCRIDVNQLLSNTSVEELVVRCGEGQEQDFTSILASIDMVQVEASLERWRREEFSKMEWMEEYSNMTVVVAGEMEKVVKEVQSLVGINLSALEPGEVMVAVVASPQLRTILDSLTTIMAEMAPMLENTQVEVGFGQLSEFLEEVSSLPMFTTNLTTVESAFRDWPKVAESLVLQTPLTEVQLEELSRATLSPSLLLLLHRRATLLLSHLCGHTPSLSKYLTFSSPAPLNLARNLCLVLEGPRAPQLLAAVDLQGAKVAARLYNCLLHSYIQDFLVAASALSPASLATSTNLTLEEVEGAMERMGEATVLLPWLNTTITDMVDKMEMDR